MDADKPEIQVIFSPTPWYKRRILWIFLIVLLLIPLGFYAYKNYFIKTPAQPEKAVFSCPVPKEYCNKGEEIIFDGKQALEFRFPNSTSITAPELVVDYTTSSATVGKTRFKIVHLAFILAEACYTTTFFIMPSDSSLRKIDLLPLKKGELVATASRKMVIQLQKRLLDPNTLGQPDYIRCPVTNLQQKDLGEYQKITADMFQ